jgi:hypothetical protein
MYWNTKEILVLLKKKKKIKQNTNDYVKLHIDIIHISSIKKTRFYKIQGKYIKNSTLKGNSQIRWVLTKQNIIQYKIGLVLVRSTFYWWRKPGDLEKTTDLSQVTDKLCCTPRPDRDSNSHHWWLALICIGSCKSNYHTITATMAHTK